jgi:hypothetical protein
LKNVMLPLAAHKPLFTYSLEALARSQPCPPTP